MTLNANLGASMHTSKVQYLQLYIDYDLLKPRTNSYCREIDKFLDAGY
ncbi:MAG: hypothetical protein US49_C0010G0036 [candidate division TM6 bacterium GW2011_GWF2_37_49]|nr:MAG: hypothetical protein US49_C0010G0036 [candidate division TM6 bacterium GW2011_GWF2_37_49]